MWTPVEAVSLLTYFIFVFWQPSQSGTSTDNRNWYDAMRSKIGCTVPGSVFGIAWAILFGLITSAGYLYLGPAGYGADSNLYVASYVIFVFNVLLTKVWTPVFFNTSRAYIGLAMFIAIFILLSAITFLVLLGYETAWLPFSLYVPYVLWCGYAVYLNSRFYFYSANPRPELDDDDRTNSSTTNRKSKSRIKSMNSAHYKFNIDSEIGEDRARSSHRMRQKKKSSRNTSANQKKITINI